MEKENRMNKERRDSPRISCRLTVDVWGRSVSNKMIDFSIDGAFISTPKAFHFKPDDQIDIILKFPRQLAPMQVKARIKRVTDSGIGVKFENLDSNNAKTVAKFINDFERLNPLDKGENLPPKAPPSAKRKTEEKVWLKFTRAIRDKYKRR